MRFIGLATSCGALAVMGCGGGPEMGADMGPMLITVGQDLDEKSPRALTSDYKLPAAFDQALVDLSIPLASLNFPDIGFTAAKDATRLHWTDLLRHQGQLGPTFGHMAAADVEKALALSDDDKSVRELLVAQNVYQFSDQFRVSRYDRAITVDATAQPLVEALRVYYEHPAVKGAPAAGLPAWSDVEPGLTEQAKAFPVATQVAVAQCIAGLLIAADLRDQAFTSKGLSTLEQWATFSLEYRATRGSPAGLNEARTMSKGVDFDQLSRAGQIAVRAVESLRIALRGAPVAPGARIDLKGPLGRIAIAMDAADDTWSGGDVFLLVDGAGNDNYLDDTASNRDLFHPVSAVVDLAGNDQYHPSDTWDVSEGFVPDEWGDPGSRQAAGIFGIAVLDDGAGDDTYKCGRFCQGFGLFGVGVLIDRSGVDAYKGYDLSQGAAQFGFGLLVDTGAGKDSYETLQTSQGYGDTRGIGWLVDDGGDDTYLAIEDPIIYNWANEDTNWSGSQGFGFGNRAGAGAYLSGGLGGLFDLAGNDRYQCAVMCQGFGYFFGTGLLWDKQGNDQYVVTHKYGIGGATHQSVGLFFDEQGADTYTYAGHGKTAGGEGIGLGYDLGVAYHIDGGKEKDVYTFPVDVGWIMGFARHPSLGVLINEGGDDEYHITGAAGARSLGTSEGFLGDRGANLGTTNTISLGMFLDLGGTDVYDVMQSGAGNKAKWVQSMPIGDGWVPNLDHGYGLDTE